jgi:hypothetical protein
LNALANLIDWFGGVEWHLSLEGRSSAKNAVLISSWSVSFSRRCEIKSYRCYENSGGNSEALVFREQDAKKMQGEVMSSIWWISKDGFVAEKDEIS